jgi:hypothetical protein
MKMMKFMMLSRDYTQGIPPRFERWVFRISRQIQNYTEYAMYNRPGLIIMTVVEAAFLLIPSGYSEKSL